MGQLNARKRQRIHSFFKISTKINSGKNVKAICHPKYATGGKIYLSTPTIWIKKWRRASEVQFQKYMAKIRGHKH